MTKKFFSQFEKFQLFLVKPFGLIMCGIKSSYFQMGFNPVQSYLGDIVVIRTPTAPSTRRDVVTFLRVRGPINKGPKSKVGGPTTCLPLVN